MEPDSRPAGVLERRKPSSTQTTEGREKIRRCSRSYVRRRMVGDRRSIFAIGCKVEFRKRGGDACIHPYIKGMMA